MKLIEILVRVDSTSDSSTDSKPSKSSMDSESTDEPRDDDDSKSSMDSKSTDDSRDDKEGDGEGDTRGEETTEEEEEEEEGTHLETSSTHSQLDISRHCSEDPEPNTLHVSEANECGLGLSRTSPRGFSNPLIARIA